MQRGAGLFERITTLSERCVCHRTQKVIVARYADAIVAAAGGDRSSPLRIVEWAAGTAAKTGSLP